MVIQITSENINLFEKLIPVDIAAKIYDSTYFFLGAVHANEEDDPGQAVGVLVFSLEKGKCNPVDIKDFSDYEREANSKSEMTISRIEWVFVDEEYRRLGHFAELIEVFYECMDKADIDPIICDIPDNGEHEDLIAALAEWQFVFAEHEIFRLETSLDEILTSKVMIKLLTSYTKHKPDGSIVPISGAKSKAFEDTLQMVNDFVDNGYYIDKEYCDNPKMYDLELSLIKYNKELKIVAALLVRKHPSGKLQPIFLNMTKDAAQNDILALISEFVLRAKKKIAGDAPIVINCLNNNTAELIDKFMPMATALAVMRGISSETFLED